MPAELTDLQINDLVVGTLYDLGRLKWNQIAQTVQNYEVFSRIMREEKVGFESGIGLQRTLMNKTAGAARNVGMYAQDVVDVKDLLVRMNIPWTHQTAYWAFERRELLMNSGASRIVEIVKPRRAGAMIDLANLFEQTFWGKPVDSTDTLTPMGLFYWCVYNATTGFNGGNPSGFSAGAGGLDSTTNPTWANWTAQYSAVSKDDVIAKMRTAYRKIRFKSPVDVPDFRRGAGDQFRIYMNEPTLRQFEVLGEAQNENLGRDLAVYQDEMVFKKNMIVWVPYLDPYTTSNPVIFINWAWFYPVFLEGDYLRESALITPPFNHNARVTYLDCTMNYLCTDRRQATAMIAQADPAAGV